MVFGVDKSGAFIKWHNRLDINLVKIINSLGSQVLIHLEDPNVVLLRKNLAVLLIDDLSRCVLLLVCSLDSINKLVVIIFPDIKLKRFYEVVQMFDVMFEWLVSVHRFF